VVQLNEVAKAVNSAIHNKEKEVPDTQPQPDGHQKIALGIFQIFNEGVPVSSAKSEQVSEMKLWLAAIANGQLKIIDTAAAQKPVGEKVPLFDEDPPAGSNGDGAETPQD